MPQARTVKEQLHVEIVNQHIWSNLDNILHIQWGFEARVPEEFSECLAGFSVEEDPTEKDPTKKDLTARHIRFTPDFFVVQRSQRIVYLLEYKNSQSPLYHPKRIADISRPTGETLRWQDIGQWQTAAHDNYAAIQKTGAKVAVLYYVAYHDERLLLCDYVDSIQELFRDKVRSNTQTGSRTPYMNFDVRPMRTLQDFLVDTHGIAPESIAPHIEACCSELQRRLPIEHHPKSPLYGT